MAQIPVKKYGIFDILSIAKTVEALFEDYLIPPTPGIYLVNGTHPVMVPDKKYYCKNNRLVTHIQEITGMVFDAMGETVITAHVKPQHLTTEPTVPTTSLELVVKYAEKIVLDNSSWSRAERHTFQDTVAEFIRPEWRFTVEIYDRLENLLMDLRLAIVEFIGNTPDDKWVIHFVKKKGHDLIVEKTIDFRIHDWIRRTNSGEWV